MHIFSFDRSCEILLCHSSISAETSTFVTLTWCTDILKLTRMLKYRNNTYNNSHWQQHILEKKRSEKINQRKKQRKSTVERVSFFKPIGVQKKLEKSLQAFLVFLGILWSLERPLVDAIISNQLEYISKKNCQNFSNLFWFFFFIPNCLITESIYCEMTK